MSAASSPCSVLSSGSIYKCRQTTATTATTRRALGAAHLPPTKVFRRLSGSVNKTILKPSVAVAANTFTIDFLDVKFRIPMHIW